MIFGGLPHVPILIFIANLIKGNFEVMKVKIVKVKAEEPKVKVVEVKNYNNGKKNLKKGFKPFFYIGSFNQ